MDIIIYMKNSAQMLSNFPDKLVLDEDHVDWAINMMSGKAVVDGDDISMN
jgi:hypothetical protein